jgi:glycosyltransferase involved in cell wall biosynthesis
VRIAQVSTLTHYVRPDETGSIEHTVWLLSRELVRMGHEVTVFAAAGSQSPGELVATLPGPYGRDGSPSDWQLCEWINLCRAVEQSGRFDVLHSHGYLWGIPLERLSRCPMLHTLHVTPYDDPASLRRLNPDAKVAAISRFQWSQFPDQPPWAVIYHGIDAEQFRLNPDPEGYLCFLGRLVESKGPLDAIRIARALDMPLVIAGQPTDYYREAVEPFVDGKRVRYVGRVNAGQRETLLGGATALLYPLIKPEPFGLVQVEAMMCGTPVVATALGAVPEIVEPGVTGYHAERPDQLAPLVARAARLDRRAIRRRAEERFSARRMAEEYAALFERLIPAGR